MDSDAEMKNDAAPSAATGAVQLSPAASAGGGAATGGAAAPVDSAAASESSAGGGGKTVAETAKEWDDAAKGWDSGFMGSMTDRFNSTALRIVESAAARKLSREPPCNVLDFGTGTGKLSLPLAGKVASVHAVDVAPAMIATVDAKVKAAGISNVTTWCGDITGAAAPQKEGAYDLVMSGSVLTFCPDMPAVMAKLTRLMAPGALAVHFVWEYSGKAPEPRPVGRAANLHYQDGLSEAQLGSEVEAAGLRVVDSGYIRVPAIACMPCCCAAKWYYVVCEKPTM